MNHEELVFQQVAGLYRIIPLKMLRKTPGVAFDLVPTEALPRIDGIDRVLHEDGAISPQSVGEVRSSLVHAPAPRR